MELTEYLVGSAIGCVLGLMIGYLMVMNLERRSERKWKDWLKEHDCTEEKG